jgi:hypothetical protein
MHQKCSNYAVFNLLFGLSRSMWIIELLVNLFSPYPGIPTCPSTPEVLPMKECALIPYSFVVFTLDSHLSLSRSLGARQFAFNNFMLLVGLRLVKISYVNKKPLKNKMWKLLWIPFWKLYSFLVTDPHKVESLGACDELPWGVVLT